MANKQAGLTERLIQVALYNDMRSASRIIMPNYTPRGWHECDVWSVTKAGYVVEHEIKLSRSDFKADTKKAGGGKHHALSIGSTGAPSRFSFVVADSVEEYARKNLPTWAGLKVAHFRDDHWGVRATLKIVVVAPRIHRKIKVRDAEISRAQVCSYYRLWSLLGVDARSEVNDGR
ncbi:MAG: hypothetical protein COA96_16895 [SAR86 cluster bacterium]|uniref:Uncharacterized protein n=1 Tax=SAR86 cluster bacterium TaxID=2030880 RepID=A0A2A5AHG5_9GAMM|nr:MAG: hypothetical protein COA96_16895 [SAR86 cluster bacterium]